MWRNGFIVERNGLEVEEGIKSGDERVTSGGVVAAHAVAARDRLAWTAFKVPVSALPRVALGIPSS